MSYIKEYTALHPKEVRQLKYKRQYKQDNPKWDDSMILLRDLVRQNVKNNGVILDLGCGHGNFVIDELRDKFSLALGIDICLEAMNKNICLDKYMIGSAESLPFENQKFDTVISLWVLEHLNNPKKCFKEINRVLKPEGIFAFVTPNKINILIILRRLLSDNLAKKIILKLYGRQEEDLFGIHYKLNTIQEIKDLAKKYGFEICYLKENSDPSYTSFGPLSYFISKIFSSIPFSITKPHIVGILKKTAKLEI